MNEEKVIDEVYGWYLDMPVVHQLMFQECPKGNLIEYHHTLGRNIRNEFEFWKIKWDPELVDGVDMSPDHPDAISMRIIESVWEKTQIDEPVKLPLYLRISWWFARFFIKD